MILTVLFARLLLAGVFLVSAIAKLLDRKGAVSAIQDFGTPDWASRPLSWLLPFTELAVCFLFAFSSLSRWAAIGALSLLTIFTVAIAVNLIRGRKPDCHCFGQLHSEPIGWKTLARNGVLASLAVLLIWQSSLLSQGGAALTNSTKAVNPLALGLFIATLFLSLILGWAALHLLQQHGRLLVRLENLEHRLETALLFKGLPSANESLELRVGSLAPTFEAFHWPEGKTSLTRLLKSGNPILLIFSDVNCRPCHELLPEVENWQCEYKDILTIALVSHGSIDEHRKKFADSKLRNIIAVQDRRVAELYKANVTPSGILIRADGAIGSELAKGSQAIADLIALTTGSAVRTLPSPYETPRRAGAITLVIGHTIPPIRLPDLNGQLVDLASLRGKETVLLSWNPECKFCKKMLPDLRLWERAPIRHTRELFVVSTGTREATQSLGLQSTTVLGNPFGATSSLGLHGTPSALLIDAEGRVASEPAFGAAAVLALMKGA
jgi:peroxiredoxin/uncharacterized membrane protein YphA (DoxX/SURF4 family)